MSGGRPGFVPTPEQAEVVRHQPAAPLRVEAAAGSGKTGTMAALFAARIAQGVAPGQLMAVTFTEKAAGELRLRIAAAVADVLAPERAARELIRLERAWVGTFHQLAFRLLREHAYRAGVSPELALVDEVGAALTRADTRDALEGGRPPGPGVLPYEPDELAELERLDEWLAGAGQAMRSGRAREADPWALRRRAEAAYAGWAAAGHDPGELGAHRQALEMTVALWAGYEARLAAARAVDFDGLLRLALTALRPRSELQRWCRRHFDCLIVDEFQDTSQLQVQLLQAWARPGFGNVVAVGDPRQAIYGWRDAAPEVLKVIPGRLVVLDRNHRSRGPILSATDRLIRVDPTFADSPPVTLHRTDEPGVPVFLGVAPDIGTEARAIAAVLRTVVAEGLQHPGGRRQPVAWRDCAVLAYTLSRLQGPLEEALRQLRIPYRAGGGMLFERPEVQDLLAHLRAATDPDDDASWLRCAQGALHRLPDAVILALGPAERPLHERMRQALAGGTVAEPWRARMARLVGTVDRLAALARQRPPAQVVGAAIAVTGLGRRQEARARLGDGDGRRAASALRELHRLCLEAEASGRAGGLDHLLQRLQALAADERTPEPPPAGDEDSVALLTVHRAKGLEFPFVILADGRPFRTAPTPAIVWDRAGGGVLVTRLGEARTRAAEELRTSGVRDAERAERRRVWYVGMTRAMDALLVTTTPRGRGSVAGDSPEAMAANLAAASPSTVADDDFLVLVAAMADPAAAVRAWPDFPAAPIARAAGLGPAPAAAPAGDGGGSPPATARLATRWREVVALEEASGVAGPGESARADVPVAPVPLSRPLSFTQLEAVQVCPRRAGYLRLGLPPTDPEHEEAAEPSTGGPGAGEVGEERAGAGGGAELGIAVHAVLETVHRAEPARAPSAAALEAALGPWAGGLGPAGAAAARALLAGYLGLAVAGWPTVATEVRFGWRLRSGERTLSLAGSIDRVARARPGVLWLLDYKTADRVETGPESPAAHQLRLYAMAWRDGLGGTDRSELRAAVVDLRRGRLCEVAVDEASLGATRGWIAGAATRLHAGTLRVGSGYPDRPCGGCAFRSACPERRPEAALGAGPLPVR